MGYISPSRFYSRSATTENTQININTNSFYFKGGDRRDLNPHDPEPQSGALTISATATVAGMGVEPTITRI